MNAMKIYQINEIFYSLQGEGFYAGQASVFVRFAHCNLKCPFCDTEFQTIAYSFNKLELESFVLTLLEKEQVASKPNIVFTGGEPTLQLCENEPLFDGFYRCVETNGYKIAPSWIEWVTFSPKRKPIVPERLQRANEVKILYSLFSNEELSLLANAYPNKHFFIQAIDWNRPIDYDIIIAFCKKYPRFRLSLQTHKFLAIR